VTKDFSALVQVSPNLYDLTIYFKTLETIFNNDSACQLLGQRITHLKIHFGGWDSDALDTFPMTRLASIFSHLKCLCFENGDCFRDAPE
jgi:hypothetical protein